ncbi:hypothetical protein [Thiolapillus sp.]
MRSFLNKAFGILALTAGSISFSPAAEQVDAYPQTTPAPQENPNSYSYHAELQRRMASMSDEERKLLQSMNEMRQQDKISQNNESGKKSRHRKKDGNGAGKKRRKGKNNAQGYNMGYANLQHY